MTPRKAKASPRKGEEILKQRIKDVSEIMKTQCSNGNWNYSEYMFGMANGIILCHAILTDTLPLYLSLPKKWLKNNRTRIAKAVVAGKPPERRRGKV